jgi:uncharacterized membrane protein YidH (DUF202 family)
MSQRPSSTDDPKAALADHRTRMATFRTQLALDTTTLAWVRTALSMTSFGFGLAAFFRTLQRQKPDAMTAQLHESAVKIGMALIVLGILSLSFAGVFHWLDLRQLHRGEPPVLRQWPLSIAIALLFVIFGLIGLWALSAY